MTRESLPAALGEWQQVAFEAAMATEDLAQGQYWWVHQWNYSSESHVAVVSFDQLGQNQWHELTYCYRNQNKTIEQRDVYDDAQKGGQFVVATMRGEHGDLAVLVFSVFYEDGEWAVSPSVNLTNLNQKQRTATIANRTFERLNPIITRDATDSSHDRALQCQVLVACNDGDLQSTIEAAIQLHLDSRARFRELWLSHAQRMKEQAEPGQIQNAG